MTLRFKEQYIQAIRERYYKATKRQKSLILDELCEVTGYDRKWAIKILAKGHKKQKNTVGRSRVYSKDSITHLQKLWHILGRICSKKMVAAFPVWLEFYEATGFNEEIKKEILAMSSSTIDRHLRSYKAQFARRKRSGTQSSKKFMNVIPIKDFTSSNQTPGYLQADTVAHCGNSLSGQFVWSLTVTDEYSGWTVNRATFGKNSTSIVSAMMKSFWDYPFNIKSLNTDSGSEFINENLREYLESQNIEFTRSRPYRKNDNCYVEQKNFTHVRELFGYERYDKEDLIFFMNDIYTNYFNVLHNFFIPQLKSVQVIRVGAKYKRKYDSPKTPYHRLMESSELSIYQKEKLKGKYESLNPIKLKKELNEQMKRFRRILDGKSDYRYKLAS